MTIITMGHGAGGRLTQQLLDSIIRPAFNNPLLNQQHDGAMLSLPSHNIALSTDSYVVYPLFFPGSNIGELAVNGTVNDLAMCGAKPLYVTCSFILTEGLPLQTLLDVVEAIRCTALHTQVQIVAGDIKVVEKTSDNSLYINTTGIGILPENRSICPQSIAVGDAIILSGDIGRHGLAVLGQRGNFNFEPPIESDCASLWPLVACLLENGITLHCLRDLTRGGLAGGLIELSATRELSFEVTESAIPVSQAVHGACEILGLDPHYVANEGRMIVFVPQDEVPQTLALLKQFPEAKEACQIGNVQAKTTSKSQVVLKTLFGSKRVLELFSGEQLPRIC